ncbi:MAG TPA: hypothetical protein VMU49_00785 [Candidatus Acidoferrales bacterium]|nr:hypothetical protein [Candidatus Acidoferrales bacterium]
MRSAPLAILLVLIAVVLVVFGYLYWVGDFELFTRTGSGPQHKHALVLIILAIASLVAANFARPRTL